MLRCYSDHVAIESQETRENKWNTLPTKTTAADWNWQKINQMLSNTLRLNFCYLKIIYTIHPYCHPKIIVHILILKNKQKNRCVCIQKIIRLVIKMEMKMKNNHIETTWTDLNLDMATNIANTKSVSVWWWCLYVLTNTYATLEAQFIKKLS